MPRRLSLAILLGLITTAVLSFGLTAGAAPKGGAPGDDEIAAAQQRLAEMRMEAGSAYEAHDNAVFQLAELDDKIAATDEELAAAKEELDAAEEELQERAAQMYKSGNVGFVDVLVGAEDFPEFANRLELWMDLIVQERDEFERVRDARDELAQKKADLEAKRERRTAALAEADAQMDRASGLEADAQSYLDTLNAEVREAMEAEQARQAELARKAGEKLRAQLAAESEDATPVAQTVPVEEAAPVAQTVPVEEVAPDEDFLAKQAAARQAEREAAESYAQEKAAEAEEARLAAERAQAAEEAEALQAAAEAAEERAALAEERAARRAAEEEAAAQQAAELAAAQEQYAADQAAAEEQQAGQDQYGLGGETTTAGGNQYGGATGGGAPTGAAGAQPSTGAGGVGSGSGSAVVAESSTHMGTPYVFSPPGPCENQVGEDCSCHTMLVYQAFGISLPDSPGAQMGYGSPVSGAPQAGDLVFWNEDGSGITHVGIATGNGTTLHASAYAGYVTETPIDAIPGYVGARRLL